MLCLYKRLEFTEHLRRGWKGWEMITILSNNSAKRLGKHHQFDIFWLVFVFHCSGNPENSHLNWSRRKLSATSFKYICLNGKVKYPRYGYIWSLTRLALKREYLSMHLATQSTSLPFKDVISTYWFSIIACVKEAWRKGMMIYDALQCKTSWVFYHKNIFMYMITYFKNFFKTTYDNLQESFLWSCYFLPLKYKSLHSDV